MCKIRIKNFGPIKEGYHENDGWMDVKKITVFIGNQGSGKSTVAKLISTLTWIEKALIRGDFREKDLTVYNRFKKHCAYQNIGNYFKDDSRIEYKGKAYYILFEYGNVLVKKNEDNGYLFPKIMYVPADRNFVSSVKNVDELKGLPSTLYTFSYEDRNAKENLMGPLSLPINNVKFEYRKPSGVSWIVGKDYEVKLAEASSGFQSFVPLFLVSRYLAVSINKKSDTSVKEISIDEEKRIRKEIEKIYSNPKLSEEVKKASLEYLTSRFKYACFINIIEEIEQNLYPSSQRKILNSLLGYTNLTKGNKLILTTHSPYIINYLMVAIMGNSVLEKIKNAAKYLELKKKLKEIVPIISCIASSEAVIYELNENGSIIKLPTYEGLPSDDNFLNKILEDTNEIFDKLIEIEDLCA